MSVATNQKAKDGSTASVDTDGSSARVDTVIISSAASKGDVAKETPNTNTNRSRGKLCRFYASGQCKNGSSCKFIHSDEMVQQQQQLYGATSYESVMSANAYGQAPAPVFVTTPPGAPM